MILSSVDLKLCKQHERSFRLDPETFESNCPSDDELTWVPINADGNHMFAVTRWLLEHNITEWWWKDRSPSGWGDYYTIYFKNGTDAIMFKLGYT